MNPTVWQRIEGGVVAALCLAAAIPSGNWPWLLGLFLVFDLSMAGYLGGTRPGAWTYNAVHLYAGPAAAGAAYALFGPTWLGILALAWAFHVGTDRALGYGLKFDDAFEHTHLGMIGRRGASRAGRAGVKARGE